LEPAPLQLTKYKDRVGKGSKGMGLKGGGGGKIEGKKGGITIFVVKGEP